MAQHDQVIDNGPGLTVRTDINAAFAAIFSSSSGTVEPTVKVAGQLWFNTTTGKLSVRNAANTAWTDLSSSLGGAITVTSPITFTGTSASEEARLIDVRDNRATTGAVGNAVFGIMRQNSTTACLMLGNDGNSSALIGGNNVATRFGKWVTGVFTEYMRVNTDGTVVFSPVAGVTVQTTTTGLEIVSGAPRIKFTDSTAGADAFWVHVDGNNFYVLTDRDADGAYETPYPLTLRNANADGQLYGNQIITSANIGSYTAGRAYPLRVGGVAINFNWSGQSGQPSWLWGGNDGTDMYVYNPSNFNVNYANSAGNADTVDGIHGSQLSGVYTGGVSNETNFPIGHTIMYGFSGAPNRNAAVSPCIYGNSQYVGSNVGGAGAALSGGWQFRGCYSSGNIGLAQRVS
jgi:hypothetical protein